jgi:hypothetical protein
MNFIKKILLAIVLIFGYVNISSSDVEARSNHSKAEKKHKRAEAKKAAKKKSKKNKKAHKRHQTDGNV